MSIWSCFAYVACLLPFLSTAYRIQSAESVTLFLSVWLMFHGFRVCRLLMLMFCYVCLMFVCICCRVYVFNAMCIHMCIHVWFELFTLTCKFIRVPICALICELECDICVLIRVYYYICICLCIDCVFCTEPKVTLISTHKQRYTQTHIYIQRNTRRHDSCNPTWKSPRATTHYRIAAFPYIIASTHAHML